MAVKGEDCVPCCLAYEMTSKLSRHRLNECYKEACCGVTASNLCVQHVRDDFFLFFVCVCFSSPPAYYSCLPSWTLQSVAALDVGMLGKTMVRFYTRRAVVQRVCLLHLFPQAVFSLPAKNTVRASWAQE